MTWYEEIMDMQKERDLLMVNRTKLVPKIIDKTTIM